MTLHIFVGYDQREHAAWMVCKDTLLNPVLGPACAAGEIEVHPVSHRELRDRGYFDRPWTIDTRGQFQDLRDGRPFSTEFSHTRFLVPKLARDMGITDGPVVFVDCDFLFIAPITKMIESIDPTKVVSVVKRDYAAMEEGQKMDGMLQQSYFRKLWSSLMVFNMGHQDIDCFLEATDYDPNWMAGHELHGFVDLKDEEIGSIDPSWNHIPLVDEEPTPARAIHWSLGGPWMRGYEHVPYASVWRQRYKDMVRALWEQDNLAPLYQV